MTDRRPHLFPSLPLLLVSLWAPHAAAQVSLPSAVNLALKNSPKVLAAQADVAKARAVLSESRDAFVPAVLANGGVGKSTGAPLSPPVVFSIAAQSLVYNHSQADYIHAAKSGVESAQLALDAVRTDTVEDTTSSYITLDNALQKHVVQAEALAFAHTLVGVTADRVTAGVDAHVELTRARHTEAQIHLQQLLLDDEIAEQSDHLSRITGLGSGSFLTDHSSIPVLQLPSPASSSPEQDGRGQQTGVSAAYAAARAKQFTARGDRHALYWPQIAFSASYSRISTAFTTYSQYYPAFGRAGNSFNSLNFGVEVSVPLLDMVRHAKARESAAEAVRSLADARGQTGLFLDARRKLRRSTTELAARQELARLDRELAQDQLNAVLIRLQATAGAVGGEQMSPRDEENARLQERLRALDILSADLQLQQAEISLLRQEGSLAGWLAATVPSAATGAPATATGIAVPVAPTTGIPSGTTPAGSLPAAPPTVGTPPATLPSSPVTTTGSPHP